MPQSSSHFSSNPSLPIGHMSVSAPLGNISSGLDPAQASLNRLQQLVDAIDSTLRLPNSPRSFAIYLLGLLIVFVGAFLHVLVAAQIMQAEFTLSQLQEEYRAIEQQNGDIIFQIARDANMARLHQEIVKAGYVPVKDREYVFVPHTVADNGTGAEETASLAEVAGSAAHEAEVVAATQPAIATNRTYANRGGGQWERWEEFWRNTLNMAPGSAGGNPASSPTIDSSVSHASTMTPNFWAVWWEQASEQGAKLVEQIRGQ